MGRGQIRPPTGASATKLVRLEVSAIVTHGTPGSLAAKRATTTIPIVMAISGNAVATGLVQSIAQPRRRHHRIEPFFPELNAKRLESPQGGNAAHSPCGRPGEPGRSPASRR